MPLAVDGPDARGRAETILFYGQSNAGGGGHDTPLLTEARFGDRVVTFGSRRQIYGVKEVGDAELHGIVALTDPPKLGARPATAMGTALAAGHGDRDAAVFLFTVWHGNQPLETFGPGTPAWRNLMAAARRAGPALAEAGRDGRVTAVAYLQGENGPKDRAKYGAGLDGLLDEMLPALAAAAGQHERPVCLLLQVNRNNETARPASGVELAQWDVAQRRTDTVLAGPSYQFPLFDRIHHSALGRLMAGELLALAYDLRVRHGVAFAPLHPVGVEREGMELVLRFALPPHAGGLRWETDWVQPSEQHGFLVRDSKGKVPVLRLAIDGEDRVSLQLGRAPEDGLRVLYAQKQPHVKGWGSARGQLACPSGRASVFHGMGYAVPASIDHYCIRFEMEVA